MKIHANLEKRNFQQKLISQIWDRHWIRGVETSPRVVSIPDSKYQLVLHVKRGKVKLIFFTFCLKKCNFLQTTSNIDLLCTIRKHFSLWVWIRDCYLKIRLWLARINCQSFVICTKKRDDDLGTLVANRGYHWDEEVVMSILAPKLADVVAGEPRPDVVNTRLDHAHSRGTTSARWQSPSLGAAPRHPLSSRDRPVWWAEG